MTITDKIKLFKDSIPNHVKLVAVSKFYSAAAVQEAYDAGHRVFGESRQQEVDKKNKELPDDIEWHFIGHLQRNKVKSVLSYIHTIQSVDSIRLFNAIEKQAIALDKKICCLLQIHIADEESKHGFSFDECRQFLKKGNWRENKFAYIGGIMGMATNTDNKEQVRSEFRSLKKFYDELKATFFSDNDDFVDLSMGMSGDYKIAIGEGSTIIRVGSSIFGER